MRKILVFGAGKSATVLINYLLKEAEQELWFLTVADANFELAETKVGESSYGKAVAFDISEADKRQQLIGESDLVISLLPPALHILVARDCLEFKKNLLTASYADNAMKELADEVKNNNLLFLCEMGLDPGIDHMSAKKMINEIHDADGKIYSFLSHCGGLVAPESDDNPWRYKISWNPRNVMTAGKAGAIFKKDNNIEEWEYEKLFSEKRFVEIPGHESLCWYPNRDSLSYINTYGLNNCSTFIRTTLRHPDFLYGWKNIIDLKLTSEEIFYETDNKTLMQFFKEHFESQGFSKWLEQKMIEQFEASKKLLENLANLVEMEEEAQESGVKPIDEFMMVDEEGDLQQVDIDELKTNTAATVAFQLHEAKLTLKQLFFLGMDDDKTLINKGSCSAADILQFALEKKLSLQPGDKDLVVMLHEIEYKQDNKKYKQTASLLVTGEDDIHTAMAKTVGLPLGIAAKLILNDVIQLKGLHIPVVKEIYEPVLAELTEYNIQFKEEVVLL
ncbi:MAG: saccharopine dehydrogenase NADP-binding domain-containing protein [Bacteroidota bacterium]|nr:saccharopine dehydrogenase NADP-binding domain-containing protein [Bacteroidota bacterium]